MSDDLNLDLEPAPVEGWRRHLPAEIADSAHTVCDMPAIELPPTVIDIASQAVKFTSSKVAQLNRWFSIVFGEGEITHTGTSVDFSAPPAFRFHLLPNGPGIELDSLKGLDFQPGSDGANTIILHLTRIGDIHFQVKL